MKKYVLPGILCFLLFRPLALVSKQLFLKMSVGLFPGGKVHDVWQSTTNYYNYQTIIGESTNPGLDVSLEFIYKLNRNFGFSLGIGHISRSLNGNTARFTPPATSDFIGDFFYSPEFNAEVYPIYLSAIFSFFIIPSIQWNFQ